MKLEVGMYVRNEKGYICKIRAFDDDLVLTNNAKFITYKSNHNEIIKASNNIIDLIEVGDYVNGYKVAHRTKSLLGFEDGQDGDWYLSNENIKSIVTKEQFESMIYKVGE